MKRRAISGILGVLVILLAPSFVLADDIPLKNWTIPQDELTKQVDVTQGVAFVGMVPCRIVDTRPSQGFPAAWGPPALVMNATRNFDLNSAPHCTGIPASVEAYSLNVTVAEPVGPGDLRMYPQGSPPATPTSLMNWSGSGAAFAIANAAIVPAGTGGGVTVQMAGTSGHLIIDINGYWTDSANPDVFFDYHTDDPSFAAHFFNSDINGSSDGVRAQTSSSIDGASGVNGSADGSLGRTYGVYGTSNSTTIGAAGVYGLEESGVVATSPASFSSGVRGESLTRIGVLGLSGDAVSAAAITGRRFDGTGAQVNFGNLGSASAGVFYSGGLTGSGTKNFVEPHPTDPTKALKYVSLEGNEAGTYFRGRGRFERGMARIQIPEDFRIVTAEEGLSIQVTPIGEMASVAVVRIGLDGIVVKGSRNVEFFYTVNGVRRAYPIWNPIVENEYFIPDDPSMRMPLSFSAVERERLIANGTYNADGTPNLETAERLGWAERWKTQDKKPSAQPRPDHSRR